MNANLHWLARELSHPVLFDEGIEAARNACVAGASVVAAAITAAAYCDSPLVGLPALRQCLHLLRQLDIDESEWCRRLARSRHGDSEFAPGFGYVSAVQSRYLRRVCSRIVLRCHETGGCPRVEFYLNHHEPIDAACGSLHPTGLIALYAADRQLSDQTLERWFLSVRIDNSVAQAQLAREMGLKAFSFLTERHVYEGSWPARTPHNDDDALRLIGLEPEECP